MMTLRNCILPLFTSIFLLPVNAIAQSCDAYFPFDGDLADASGNGYDGLMIGPKGAIGESSFAEGRTGQALHLNGSSAMRSFIDLSYEICPQITVAAWVQVNSSGGQGDQYIVSTGSGNGPGIRMLGSTLIARGTGNGLWSRDVLRPNVGWIFVAAVYDYSTGAYRLRWRGRSMEGKLNPSRNIPEDALWVGAFNDRFSATAKDVYIDDLRIIGRALSPDELRELQANRGTPPGRQATQPPAATSNPLDGPALPQEVPGISGRLQNNLPEIDVGDRPSGPIDLTTPGETADSGVVLLDVPEGLGAANSGVTDPDLTMPDDTPGQQLQEDIDAAKNATPPVYPDREDYEVYRRNAQGPTGTIDIVLPGSSSMQTVTYQIVDGVAVTEGDIILGNVAELDAWAEAVADESGSSSGLRTRRQGLNLIKNTKYLWPGGVIPYTFHSNMTPAATTLATNAANQLSTLTNLTVRPRAGDGSFVEFTMKDKENDACSSRVGMRQGSGSQKINVDPACQTTTLMHEILHAAGFWHEQSRPDRDQFVEIYRDNVESGSKHNFNKKDGDKAVGIGPYNYSSIMHYGEFTFGKECIPVGVPRPDEDCRRFSDGTTAARTIRAKQPGVVISRIFSTDVAAINAVYPSTIGPQQGLEWGDDYYATATAVGDVDGDGRGELIVGRHANEASRFYVFDDQSGLHQMLATGPTNWGSDIEVTDIAVGDVDGDGRMEIGVTRRSNTSNRFYVYKYQNNQLVEIFSGGNDWGSGYYATSIAFGDVDGDGRDEIAVGRRANESGRYYLFDDASASEPFKRLAVGGSTWGSGNYTTDLAFGDVNNNGRQELGITRRADSGQRYEVVSYANGRFTQLHAGGQPWGSGYYGTAIAFGNIDNDDADELIVGRRADENSRFYVLDDQANGFSVIQTGGDLWGRGYYVVGVDMADVDGDNIDEIIVARNAGENGRYFVFNDQIRGFSPILASGAALFGGVGATDIAAGDVNSDGKADLVVSYDQKVRPRMRWEIIYLNPPSP